jgi:hypothetical protein
MADDRIKLLEERLTRMEAALSQRPAAGQGGFTPPGGVVVDPAPWPQYPRHWGGWGPPRWPIVDPAPWPTPVVDPAPWPPTTVSDPAPFPGGVFSDQLLAARTLGRPGQVVDPAPIDFGRLSVSQLESTLHSINSEKARLDSLQALVTKQLDRAKKQEKG